MQPELGLKGSSKQPDISFKWQPPSAEEEALIPKTGPAEALTYGIVGAPAGIAGAAAATGFNVLQEVGTEEIRSQLPEGQAYDWLAMIMGMGGSLASGTAPSLLLRGAKPRLPKTGELTGKDIKETFRKGRELRNAPIKETPFEYSGEIIKQVTREEIDTPYGKAYVGSTPITKSSPIQNESISPPQGANRTVENLKKMGEKYIAELDAKSPKSPKFEDVTPSIGPKVEIDKLKALQGEMPTPRTIPPSRQPESIGGGSGAGLPHELAKPEVRVGITGDIAKAAKDKAVELGRTEAAGQGKRLYHQVAEALDNGDIEVEFLPETLQKYNIDLSDFVIEYKNTISTSARKLQQLSTLKKHLTRLAKTGKHPELEGILDKMPDDFDTFWHRFNHGWGTWPGYIKIDNVRRASLVSQLATTMRNVESQTGNYGLHILDKTLEKKFGGSNSIEASEYITTFFGQFKKTEKDRVISILEKFPIEQTRLLNTPAGEVTLGHNYARALNTLNNMQESFFRRATFDASLREQLRGKGFDVLEMMNNPREIPEEMIHRAVNDALDLTFAQFPKEGTFGNAVLKAYKAIPQLTLVNPFPRFLANSYKFLMEHSPVGYLKLIEKTPEGKFLAQNPETRAKIMAKATTGTLLLGGALAIRESDLAGEKWYQVKVGDKNIDMRPFAPFSTYLFMAEALKQMGDTGVDVIKNGKNLQDALMNNSKMTTQDIVQGIISINRIAGTGLVLVDLVRSGSVGKKMDMLRDVLAQYIGGFTVPFRTIKDAISGVSEEEAKIRDTRKTLLGPAVTNIPGVSQLYPESVSPVEKDTPKSEHPILRQLTGISLSQAKPIREEINKLGLEPPDYLPQTGYPEADREISKIMRTNIDTILMPLIRGTMYRNGNDVSKKLLLTESLSSIKKDAFMRFRKINPRLALEIYKKGLDKDIRAIIEQKRR